MNFDVFSTVNHSIELFHLPTLMHNSLFINNIYVTLLSSTCFEHSRVTYILLMNKELCIKVGKWNNWLHEVNHVLNPFLYFITVFLSAPRFGKKSVHPQFSTRYTHVAKRSIQNSRARLKSQVDFVFFKKR